SHAMAFDTVRGVTVMFGGLSASGGMLGDTWEYNGTRWVAAPAGIAAPSPRRAHAMAYGSAQKQMLLFGGTAPGALFGDTWTWDGATWTLLAAGGPPARQSHAMAYNANCDSIILFGGLIPANQQALGDTWEWNGAGWNLTNTNGPSPRADHAMAHDTARDATVIFGGDSAVEGSFADTWGLTLNQTAPQVTSFYSSCGDQKLLIAFSAPMSAATAEDPSRYQITCDNTNVNITQATLAGNPQLVCLFTDQALGKNCVLF